MIPFIKHNKIPYFRQRHLYSVFQRRHRVRFTIPFPLAAFVSALCFCLCVGAASGFAHPRALSFHRTSVRHSSRSIQRLRSSSNDDSNKNDDIEQFRRRLEHIFTRDWRRFRAELVHGEKQKQHIKDCPMSQLPSLDYAHPIDNVEEGSVILASERLGGRLYRSVYLITSHDERNGTEAVGICRILSGDVKSLASADIPAYAEYPSLSSIPVTYGGSRSSYYKREESTFTALHNNHLIPGSHRLVPGVHIGGSAEQLDEEIRRGVGTKVFFAKGYTRFAPNQLKREMNQGLWYLAAASPDIILRSAMGGQHDLLDADDTLWFDIMTCMGGKYAETAIRSRVIESNNQETKAASA